MTREVPHFQTKTMGSLQHAALLLLLACVACGGGSPSAAPESQPPDSAGGEAPAASDATAHEAMRVAAPERDAIVTSPLVITGEARGTWYFEATFPVALLDAAGNAIGNGYAQAEGEWMTEDFVPFRAELTFTAPASPAIGTLVLQKANPSDLAEHSAEVHIPVRLAAPQP